MELSARARDNLEAGGEDGAGTAVCRKCHGDKEPSRLNSDRCRTCGKTGSRDATVRLTLPADVWARFKAEAGDTDPSAYLRGLILTRDRKKHPSASH